MGWTAVQVLWISFLSIRHIGVYCGWPKALQLSDLRKWYRESSKHVLNMK